MKNHKNIKNYKNFECKEEICSWSFDDNFDVHLMIMRDPIDKSTYDITVRFKDILNY